MTITIKQTESAPASYPASGLSPEPANAALIWQRIEAYTAHRWTARNVVWIVEGPGEWHPPLAPATIETIEIWSRANEWEAVEAVAAPLGYWLPASGPYRFSGAVGGGDLPAVALAAFWRLHDYLDAPQGTPGASSEETRIGELSESYRRSPEWLARAMQNSGAADLLRPYRRAA